MATRRQNNNIRIPARVPPPWTTRSESYWLLLNLPNPLPLDICDPLEATHPARSINSFTGGLGMIQIVRYSETPAGSYDELLIIPGSFEGPGSKQESTSRMRITRIYVSQHETLWNGRKNWNIPKHLARFEFSSPVSKDVSRPTRLTVSVFPEGSSNGDATKPFFQATLTTLKYLPAFPFSTKWSPLNTALLQPPLPAGYKPLLCGTDTWKEFQVALQSQRARIMWAQLAAEGEHVRSEGYWPKTKPWKLGLWLEDATLEIPVPEEWT